MDARISSTGSQESLPRTELDSHANMVVLGSECFVFDNILDQTCDVEPFDPTIGTAKRVPIVDAALAYDIKLISLCYEMLFIFLRCLIICYHLSYLGRLELNAMMYRSFTVRIQVLKTILSHFLILSSGSR